MPYTESNAIDLREQIGKHILEVYGDDVEIILYDGFDKALVGFGAAFTNAVCAVYDYDECIRILIEDGMDADDAEEYFEFNVRGTYAGATTPIFISKFNPNQ